MLAFPLKKTVFQQGVENKEKKDKPLGKFSGHRPNQIFPAGFYS